MHHANQLAKSVTARRRKAAGISLLKYARKRVNALAATRNWDLTMIGLGLAVMGRHSHPSSPKALGLSDNVQPARPGLFIL